MAEARPVAGALPVLTEHNCAIRLIAERFPEVCAAEERFIADLLGAPVTRQAHIAKGANCCEYCITEQVTRDSCPGTSNLRPLASGRWPRSEEWLLTSNYWSIRITNTAARPTSKPRRSRPASTRTWCARSRRARTSRSGCWNGG